MNNNLTIQSLLPATIKNSLIKGKTYVGIDFGTSTSVVSIASFDSAAKSIKVESIRLTQILEDGTQFNSERLPSVIAWYDNKVLVGEGASNLKYRLSQGKNIWYSFKMELGEDLGAKYFDSELANTAPFNIKEPKDAARVFFMYLKMLIERYCQNNNLSHIVEYAITIPASFEANQRKDLIEALDANGMLVTKQSLIDEPNAAFLSYVHTSADLDKPLYINPNYNPKVLVFDFGGGTCDISILEIGKSVNGYYSKNISISKFAKLGGDDIDRYLTYHYLLPKFLEENNFNVSDFRTQERKYIASHLYKIAENLKIQINKRLSILSEDFMVSKTKYDTTPLKVHVPVRIETSKGTLVGNEFSISNNDLFETMKVFLKKSLTPTKHKGEDDYNTVFMPIDTALRKANLSASDIDYVLFIGGSSQSPFIQEYLKVFFEDSELLVPNDLQTHVAQGAAIHSLLQNGMGKCVIQPITSEKIFVITKDTQHKVLMPAGTSIPSDIVIVNDLVIATDNQKKVELPICVGSERKMLHNLIITHPYGFPINTPIQVALEINPDKLLLIQASCMGVNCIVEPCNPFANKELTTEERIVLVAERQSNIEALQNGGTPTKSSLIKLREAYERAGDSFRAAETMELQLELYPSPNSYNSLGVLYSNAGNTDKAIYWYERALEHNPNSEYPNFNLGHCYYYDDREKGVPYLRKAIEINPNHNPALCMLGRYEKSKNNQEKAKEYLQKAYDNYYSRWKTNSLNDNECGWFAAIAEELGKKDFAKEIRASVKIEKGEAYYNPENLAKTKNIHLEKR